MAVQLSAHLPCRRVSGKILKCLSEPCSATPGCLLLTPPAAPVWVQVGFEGAASFDTPDLAIQPIPQSALLPDGKDKHR